MNISKEVFAVHIPNMEAFKMSPDEVTVFDWLLFKSAYYGHSDFYSTYEDISARLNINRHRLNVIVKRFKEAEIVSVSQGWSDKRKVTYFTLSYLNLLERLPMFIKPDTEVFNRYVERISKHQQERENKILKLDTDEEAKAVQSVVNLIGKIFHEFNFTGINCDLNETTEKMLNKLSKSYTLAEIQLAFVHFCEDIFYKRISPTHPIIYFAKVDKITRKFEVVEHYLNKGK